MADAKTFTGGSDENIISIPFVGEINMDELEKQVEASKKPKKQNPKKTAKEVEKETTPEQFETETIIPQALADERAMQASYKDEVLEEEKHRPTNAEIRAWRNDPPEPGVVDVAVAPKGPDVVRRGFTTLQMAVAFRNSLENRDDYLVVEVRDGFGMNGPILCHYVIHKAEEL